MEVVRERIQLAQWQLFIPEFFFLMFPTFPIKALEHLAKLSMDVPKKNHQIAQNLFKLVPIVLELFQFYMPQVLSSYCFVCSQLCTPLKEDGRMGSK